MPHVETIKEQIRHKGDDRTVDAARINGTVIIITGTFLRRAEIKDAWSVDVDHPAALVRTLRDSPLRADLFTFAQRLPQTTRKHDYFLTWDNVAAIPITTFKHWWESQITQESRNKVRKAKKSGVDVRLCDFNADLMNGIFEICNEIPIRQGKPFWHFGKDLATLTRLHETFLDRALFLGAYYRDELIGFIKLVDAGPFTRTFHVLSKVRHRDKAPTNALIAEAVRVCAARGTPFLVYGQYDYGKVGSKGLTAFKRDNGFQRILLPRYHVPLTTKGLLVVKLHLHQDIAQVLPEGLLRLLANLRNAWYVRRLSSRASHRMRGSPERA